MSGISKTQSTKFSIADCVTGRAGKLLDIYFGSTQNDYRIALDKESHFHKEVTVTVPHAQNSLF
jgi:hypothetical protein